MIPQACKENFNLSPFFVLPSALAGGATWLVSSVSNPLVTATIAAASVLAAYVINQANGGLNYKNQDELTTASMFAVPIALSLASTAIGFPVSIPLSLLLGVTTFLGTVAAARICE